MNRLFFIMWVILLISCSDMAFIGGKSDSGKSGDVAEDKGESEIIKDHKDTEDIRVFHDTFNSTDYAETLLVLDPVKSRSSEQIRMQYIRSPFSKNTDNIIEAKTVTYKQGKKGEKQTETKTINNVGARPVDILIIMDDSTSMNKARAAISTQLGNLTKYISDLDWKIGIITTDPNKKCVQVIEKTSDEETNQTAFYNAITSITAGPNFYEQSILTSVYGLFNDSLCNNSWIRNNENSYVVVLIVSDEDDACIKSCLKNQECNSQTSSNECCTVSGENRCCLTPDSRIPTSNVTPYKEDSISFFKDLVEKHLHRSLGNDIVVHGILNGQSEATGTQTCGSPILFSQRYRQFISSIPGGIISDIGRTGSEQWKDNVVLDYSSVFQEISKSTYFSAVNLEYTLSGTPSLDYGVKVYVDGSTEALSEDSYTVTGSTVRIKENTVGEGTHTFKFEYYTGSTMKQEFSGLPEEITKIDKVMVGNSTVSSSKYSFDSASHKISFNYYPASGSNIKIFYTVKNSANSFTFTKPSDTVDTASLKVYGMLSDSSYELIPSSEWTFDFSNFKLEFKKSNWNTKGYINVKIEYDTLVKKLSYQTAKSNLGSLSGLKLENSSGNNVNYTIGNSGSEITIGASSFVNNGVLTLSWENIEEILTNNKLVLNQDIQADSLQVDCPSRSNSAVNQCSSIRYSVDQNTNTVTVNSGYSKNNILRLKYNYVSGIKSSYVLSTDSISEQDDVVVQVNGSVVNSSKYLISKDTLTFKDPPPRDSVIDVKVYKKITMQEL